MIMMLRRLPLVLLLASLGSHSAIRAARAFQNDTPAGQLPAELRGVKVYHLDLAKRPAMGLEKLVLVKNLSYQDITLDRLVQNLFVFS